MRGFSTKTLLTATSRLAIAATGAYAQDDAEGSDEVIIVTSTKREQTIQDVPFSVNALSEEDMRRLSVISAIEPYPSRCRHLASRARLK